jgi:hypothetical protein
MRRAAIALVLSTAAASCGGSMPQPPSGDGGQILSGNERFGWDQPASDHAELASFRYAMYVDGTRSEAADVVCATTAAAAGFACTCRLPQLTAGSHTLQVAAYITDNGEVRESSRSAPVRVTMR